jgi:hypothetical protein
MIGIYQESFIQYLKDNLSEVKITSKNIITRCPWCELHKDKHHYHLYISLEAPIFRCWRADCPSTPGILSKLTKAIDGKDRLDEYVDKERIRENVKTKIKIDSKKFEDQKIFIPELNIKQFPNKEFYLKQRFKFANIDLNTVKGLVFDINKFVEGNKIFNDEKLFRLKDFLHANFVGFISEHNSIAMFRNIDPTSSFKHFKLQIKQNHFADYYRLNGNNPTSNHIVLGEGIYDIFSEHIYNNLNIKDDIKLYAASFSGAFISIIKSLAFYEQMFRMNVTILSDRDVKLENYVKLKRFNSHIIDKLTVYYNKTGKDFNDIPLVPEKFVM